MTVAIMQAQLASTNRISKPRTEQPDYIIKAGVENTFNVFHVPTQTQIQTGISTWNGAANGVNSLPVAAGSLIEFEEGTHGQRWFENFHGTYGNEITFKSSPFDQVVIRRNAGDATGGFVLYFANTKNIILDGGPIIDSDGTILYGMKLLSALTGTDGPEDYIRFNDNASSNAAGVPSGNITIKNIEIDGGWYTNGSGTLNGTGIAVKQASNYFLRTQHPSKKVENITITGCYAHNLENLGIQTGIAYSNGYIPYSNVVINNCIVANTKKTGIEVFNAWSGNNRIHDNILTDAGNATGGTAQNPATGQFFGMSITSGKANVYNNKIYRSGEHTLRIRTASGPLTTDGISSLVSYCYNNLLVEAGIPLGNTNPQSVNDNGIEISQATVTNGVYPDVYVYNNTIAKCNGAAVNIVSTATGNVRNNLLLNNINGGVTGTPTASENNPTTAPVANIDEDDYALTAAGTLVSGTTYSTFDIDNVTRDVGGEDCGAYEYLGGPISQTGADYTVLAGTSDDMTVRRESDQTTETVTGNTFWSGTSVAPGSIIEFEPGVHGKRYFTGLMGTAANPIIIRSSPLGKAIIRRPIAVTLERTVGLRSSYHVKIDGSTTPGETYGIKIMYASSGTENTSQFLFINNNTYANTTIGHPSSNITVSNVEIDGGYVTAGATNGIGIQYSLSGFFSRADWGSTTVKSVDLVIENCYVHDIEGEGLYIGDNYSSGGIGLANVTIRNNIVEKTGWDGINIKAFWSGNNSIYSNRVINAGIRTDASDGQHDAIPILSSTANVYNNFIQFSGEKGIKFYNDQGPLATEFASFDCRAWNNIIYGAGANNIPGRLIGTGISVGGSSGITVTKIKPFVFNNTIIDASDDGLQIGASEKYVSGGFVKNNIVVNNGPSWSPIISASYDAIDNDSAGQVTVSNNATSATFADSANYDYRLTAQTLASGTIGVDISATDYAGVTRETSYPDAGAYEYLGGGSGTSLVVTPNTTAGKNDGAAGPQYDEYSLAEWRNYDDVVDGWDWSYPSSRLT